MDHFVDASKLAGQARDLILCEDPNSALCSLCAVVRPGLMMFALFILLVWLALYPSKYVVFSSILFFVQISYVLPLTSSRSCHGRYWPDFGYVFRLWTDLFKYKCVIRQSSFHPSKRYLFIGLPHGVIPIGAYMTLAHWRKYFPKVRIASGTRPWEG